MGARGNAIAGISGGRTSATMPLDYLDESVLLAFENTSKEHPKTLEFIERLEQHLQRRIYLLEFRAPPRGEPPIKATFEIMEHRTLHRDGEVFLDMLEMTASFRAKHNKINPVCGCKNCKRGLPGPVAPWARSRICTAYMKIRTQRKFCASLGWGHQREYTEYVGLRADEPERVARMHKRNNDLDTDERAPLAERGITKPDILRRWSTMPFDLEVEEHDGNCTKCFLKDERDIATSMIQGEEEDADWWIGVERDYAPMRRGRPSYAQIREEAPYRMMIREALAAGKPIPKVPLLPRRVHLIVKQEQAPRTSFSCECDAAKQEDEDFDEQLSLAI